MPDSAKNSILAMFADDAKCFRQIVNIDDSREGFRRTLSVVQLLEA